MKKNDEISFLFLSYDVIIKSNLVIVGDVMYIEGFGDKRVKLYVIEGTEDLLEMEFSHKRKKYSGIVDKSYRLLVPFSDVPILEVFATKDKTNYCFTRQEENTGRYESFHLLKEKDDKFYLRADIKGNDETNCRLVGTVKDDYWFIETDINGPIEFCLYDVRKAEIVTSSFNEISFEEEESRVLAFVRKDIYSNIDGDDIYLTGLFSYIDYNGNFIAPIYDVELDVYYDSRCYNFDKVFKSYNRFLGSITNNHRNKFIEKNKHIDEVLADMFVNVYSEEELRKNNQPAKILEYRRDKK